MRAIGLSILAAAAIFASACTAHEDVDSGSAGITSNDAVALEFRFSAEVVAWANETPRKAIATQLAYVQGILTTDAGANGQTGMPSLGDVQEHPNEDGLTKRITYDVALPVAWPRVVESPASYELLLPRDVTKLSGFNAKYDGACGRNEYGRATFWHDWNPRAVRCAIDEADVVRTNAVIAPHPQETRGKYPEYDKVWEDDTLDVVAVFGIISSYTPSDEGVRTREILLNDALAKLDGAERVDAPDRPSGILKDGTVSGTILVGGVPKRVNVTGLLVHAVDGAGAAFEERFGALSEKADLIVYEGHSGLGANINALATATRAQAGKYQLVYLYGCQTLAYLEPTLHERRIALNGADVDPEGTKYLDIIANALPAYGDGGRSTLSLVRSLMNPAAPRTFEQLMAGISEWHLVVTFGEHDNTFAP